MHNKGAHEVGKQRLVRTPRVWWTNYKVLPVISTNYKVLVVVLRWSHVTGPRVLGLSNYKVLVVLCKLLLVGTYECD